MGAAVGVGVKSSEKMRKLLVDGSARPQSGGYSKGPFVARTHQALYGCPCLSIGPAEGPEGVLLSERL